MASISKSSNYRPPQFQTTLPAMNNSNLLNYDAIPSEEVSQKDREAFLDSITQDRPSEGEIDELARLDDLKRKGYRAPHEL